MALAFAHTQTMVVGPPAMVYTEITFDSAYDVAGEALAPSDVGLTVIQMVIIQSTTGYVVSWSRSAAKLLVYAAFNATTSAGVPVESSVRDLSTLTVTVLIIGR